MAYSNKAKNLRRCKKLKADGSQCRAYSKLDSDYCSLHGYDHRKKLPKRNEREIAKIQRAKKRAQTSRHQTCDCLAYSFRHRAGSGLCNFPDAPTEVYRNGDVEADVDTAYDEAFARDDDAEYEPSRGRIEPTTDEDERVERRRQIERHNSDYIAEMERIWRTTT